MNAQKLAERAYAVASAPTRSPRSLEYEVIARITYRLKQAALERRASFSGLVGALYDNRNLWTTLAAEVTDVDNGLPTDLRARIFYLSEFTRAHTTEVLAGRAGVAPLLEINTAILRGLRHQDGGGVPRQ